MKVSSRRIQLVTAPPRLGMHSKQTFESTKDFVSNTIQYCLKSLCIQMG